MSTKTVVCQECGKEKDIYIGEYNRKIKRGTGFFCSQSCSSIATNKNPVAKAGRLKYLKSEANKKVLQKAQRKRWGEVDPLNYYIRVARNRKKERDFNITVEYLREVWDSQKGKCKISGVEMEMPLGTVGFKSARPFFAGSLDRIDSSQGYVVGNIQFICVGLNYMKNSWDNEEFLQGFDTIVNSYLQLKKDREANNLC